MEFHDWITFRGAEAAALLAIAAVLARVFRWVRRMRAATRAAFAKSIGDHVASAMVPIVEEWRNKVDALDVKVNAHISEQMRRRQVDDERWACTERLYQRLEEHMNREESVDG